MKFLHSNEDIRKFNLLDYDNFSLKHNTAMLTKENHESIKGDDVDSKLERIIGPNSEKMINRRAHKRFTAKYGAFALIGSNLKRPIRVKTMSMGEIAFAVFKSSLLLILWLPLISGCAQVISKKVMKEVAAGVSFKDVVRDPARYKGITVLWGGLILEAEPVKDGTLIEVMQWPVDFRGMPQDVRFSDGKFLALDRQPLDLSIFETGRTVTIAGIVQEKRVSPWEESNYSYTLILVREIHPWPGRDKDSAYNRYYYWSPWNLP